MRLLGAPLFVLLLLVPADGTAGKPERARVVAVLDGDTLVVDPPAGERREVRLVAVQAPKPFPDGSEPWLLAHAEAAQEALTELALGAMVTLLLAEPRTNRYGQWLAQVHREDGLWLQGEMLRRGLVRVHTPPFIGDEALDMLAIEAEARRHRRGLWADTRFAVRTPEQAAFDVGTFQLVEGTVRKVARVKNRVYLNFGDDWRSDFTVSLPARLAAAFARGGLDPMTLAGRRVRVRGWLDQLNGPLIEVTHRAQLEVLDSEEGPSPTPPAEAADRVRGRAPP